MCVFNTHGMNSIHKENMQINRVTNINNLLGWQATGEMIEILAEKLADK